MAKIKSTEYKAKNAANRSIEENARLKLRIEALEAEKQTKDITITSQLAKINELHAVVSALKIELDETEAYANKLEAEYSDKVERLAAAESMIPTIAEAKIVTLTVGETTIEIVGADSINVS